MASTSDGEPRAFIGFPLSPEQRTKTEAVLDKLRAADSPRDHAGELVEVVVELTHYGLDFFYVKPLELAKVGMVHRGTARVGVAAAGKSIPMMVRKIVGAMSDAQLLQIAEFMDGLLIRQNPGDSS